MKYKNINCEKCIYFYEDETNEAPAHWCRRYPKMEKVRKDHKCGEFRRGVK